MWVVRNLEKKSCVLREEWEKDDISFVRVEGFCWGEWECDAEERPNINLENTNGFDPYDQEDEWELVSMDDGCWDAWEFPNSMSEEEQKLVLEIWESDPADGLESAGWVNVESQYSLEGPLSLSETSE